MASIDQIISRLEKFNVDTAIQTAFKSSSDGYTAEQRVQLYEGLNKDGQHLLKYATTSYAKYKNKLNSNPGFGNPDLYVTGAFFEGIQVELQGDVIKVTSTDEKGPELIAKYDPFGLGGVYKIEFIQNIFKPNFYNVVRTETGLR